jgi:hypothetical protein
LDKNTLEQRIQQQRGHYLYKRSGELHEQYREEQLIKGAKTYPEPLEPDSWTAAQAAGHAFQELIDLEQYVTMQLIKNERLEAEVKDLKEENRLLKEKVAALEAQGIEAQKQHARQIAKVFAYGR